MTLYLRQRRHNEALGKFLSLNPNIEMATVEEHIRPSHNGDDIIRLSIDVGTDGIEHAYLAMKAAIEDLVAQGHMGCCKDSGCIVGGERILLNNVESWIKSHFESLDCDYEGLTKSRFLIFPKATSKAVIAAWIAAN